jgi:hypothetical protein
MDDYIMMYGLDRFTVMDYGWVLFKLTFACSPIIIIVTMLACAREDEEEEKAKQELAKKNGSCKS